MSAAASSRTFPGIPCRLASMAYEVLLLSGVLGLTLILPHALYAAWSHRLATGIVLWAHLFVVLLAYFVGFWSHSGQTLAMKTWHLRLLTHDGRALRPARALLRYLLCWVSVGLAGVGVAWALVDRDGQFLHDRLAGTQLVTA